MRDCRLAALGLILLLFGCAAPQVDEDAANASDAVVGSADGHGVEVTASEARITGEDRFFWGPGISSSSPVHARFVIPKSALDK